MDEMAWMMVSSPDVDVLATLVGGMLQRSDI